ncbi:MAG: hypothetical protein ACYTGW_17290 [Planctomycetota bacterium]|jgi:hypothetical protein
MKPRLRTLALTTTILAATTTAQNLIQNGDFSKVDAKGNPTNWTIQKFDIAPKIVKFDTAGTGADSAFSVVHGKLLTSTGNGIGELIQGKILIVGGVTHELRADIAVGGSFNNDPGIFEFYVGGVSVAKHDLQVSRGSKPAGVTFRERVCVHFQPKTTGLQQVKITIGRRFAAMAGRTPTAYLDNVFLGRTQGPLICVRGERLASLGSIKLEVRTRPNNLFAIFAAATLLPNPLTIPGWSGQLELQSPVIPVLMTRTGNLGAFSVTVPTSATMAGARVFLQGAQAASATSVDLGYAQLINLY